MKRVISPAFLWLWVGGTLSYTADMMLFSILTLWIATSIARNFSWVTLATNGVTLAAAVPVILLGPLAGVYVDRWPKRRVMLVADGTRAVLIALLAFSVTWSTHIPSLPLLSTVYMLVMLVSCSAQFFNPARFVLISHVVEEAQRGQATALTQTTNNLVLLFSPTLTPLIFLWWGPGWALACTALVYACSFSTIWFITYQDTHASRPAPTRFAHDLRAGIRFAVSQQTLRTLLITSGLQLLGGGAVSALNLFFLLDVLHAPLALYGLTTTTTAIGALLGSSLAIVLLRRLSLVTLYKAGLLVTSIGLLIYSRLTNFAVVLVITGVFGVFQGIVSVPQGPLMMRVTPPALLGRISAILLPLQTFFLMGGTVIGGVLPSLWGTFLLRIGPFRFGRIDAVLTLGAIIALCGAIYALFQLNEEVASSTSRRTP